VRAYFKKGLKSSNKMHTITDQDMAVANKTSLVLGQNRTTARVREAIQKNARRKKANVSLGLIRTATKGMNIVDEANALLTIPQEQLAGNCWEMAAVAGWCINSWFSIPFDHIFMASVTNPGDHAFCVCTLDTLPTKLQFASVTDFTKYWYAYKWLVIDPWLNTACTVRDYLEQTGQKLEKWGREGKRVSWTGGSLGAGWYPPQGEYKDAFAISSVKLSAFG
jgi:hypothetical protein